jgi:hypothetical protein
VNYDCIVVRVNVDKTRRKNEAGRINFLRSTPV